jgi:hypothetical protein
VKPAAFERSRFLLACERLVWVSLLPDHVLTANGVDRAAALSSSFGKGGASAPTMTPTPLMNRVLPGQYAAVSA